MIDANSKASRFLEAIEKYAEQQRDEMRAEVEAFRKEQLSAANEEGTAAAFKFIQEQKQEFKASLAKEAALKETKKKRELFEKRNEMAQTVFDEAQKKLINFTKSGKYKEYLATSARMIGERLGGKKAILSLSVKDKALKSVVENALPGCEIVFDESIGIGGIRCSCPELSIILDDTLDAKFEERKRLFIENSGLIVE